MGILDDLWTGIVIIVVAILMFVFTAIEEAAIRIEGFFKKIRKAP